MWNKGWWYIGRDEDMCLVSGKQKHCILYYEYESKCINQNNDIIHVQLKYTNEGVSKIPGPRDQVYFPRRSRGK